MDGKQTIELDNETAEKFKFFCLIESELKILNVDTFKVKKVQIMGKRLVVHIVNLTK